MNTAPTHEHAEWITELTKRFGPSPADWAFTCPRCGDIATGADFKAALEEHPHTRKDGSTVNASEKLGRECIGRTLGALSKDTGKWDGRGCDWAAYGLLSGPEFVIMPDGVKVPCFAMADKSEVTA